MNIHSLLTTVQQKNASDLHLVSGHPVMLRIDGDMVPLDQSILAAEDVRTLLYSVMTPKQQEAFEQSHDLDFALGADSSGRFRVNLFDTLNGMAAVFRHIPSKIRTIDELTLPTIVKSLCSLTKGLILVTGAAGSGKSTTMAAMIDHMNRYYRRHIITIEDPIEFIHTSQQSLINQREVHTHTESFGKALRSALRENPDVIMVGELRDLETISLALTAAETGHLVLGTLHTNSAAKSIDRIVDVFDEGSKAMARSMLAGSLQGVVTQLLTKTTQGQGRIPLHEILIANSAIRNLIRENKIPQIHSTMQLHKKSGMQTFKEAVERLLAGGIISIDQAKPILNEVSLPDDIEKIPANSSAARQKVADRGSSAQYSPWKDDQF